MGAPPPAGPPSPDRRRVLLALGFGAANAIGLSRLARNPNRPPSPTGATVAAVEGPPAGPATAPAFAGAGPEPDAAHVFDVVFRGGRVIDPGSGFDRTANVGIDGPSITAVTKNVLQARNVIDASGLVVAPGFIDLISYAPNDYGIWFKVADGVTTNLGMHGMLADAKTFFSTWKAHGSPCHYGGAYDNLFMRGQGGLDIDAGQAASTGELDQLAADVEAQLHDGWLGVSFSPEYTPGMASAEIERQAAVGARYGLPSFFHGRYATDVPPDDNAKTLQEILDVARHTGAGVHVMHITSTGGTFQMPMALDTITKARTDEHLDVTCCMYPYTFWATYLGSPRFADGWQQRFHIDYRDLVIPGSGERLSRSSFERYRADNKLAAAFAIPEPDVVAGLQSELTMIGSDAILEPGNNNHPRAAGCFTRTLGHYVRDQPTISLVDALRKMTILPAQRLEVHAPALARKGRLQRGADADITVFDPATVGDRSTLADPAQEAVGVPWVMVAGQIVKGPEGVRKDVKPGQPITSVLA